MVTRAEMRQRPPLYRVWQLVQALSARQLTPTEWEEVASLLTIAEQRLFRQMEPRDQQHSLQVLRTLASRGERCHDLLVAALLHDVGKSRYPLRVWERPIVVLIRLFRPSMVDRWGQLRGDSWGWRRPFVVYEHHPAWGAQMAAAVGCSPLTVWLIRWHQGQPEPEERSWLRQAAQLDQEGDFRPQDASAHSLLCTLQQADSEN